MEGWREESGDSKRVQCKERGKIGRKESESEEGRERRWGGRE